jgi:hypothetical protein
MAATLGRQFDRLLVKRLGKYRVRVPKPLVEADSVFLNIPYDRRFGRLYRAYIVGLVELGLTPKQLWEYQEESID